MGGCKSAEATKVYTVWNGFKHTVIHSFDQTRKNKNNKNKKIKDDNNNHANLQSSFHAMQYCCLCGY